MKSSSRRLWISLFSTTIILAATQAFAADQPDQPATKIPVPPPAAGTASEEVHVGEKLAAAKASYDAGKYTEALDLLTQAQNGIYKKRLDLYRALLPAAPDGWQAESSPEFNNAARFQFLGGFITVERKYVSNGHTVTLRFTIRPQADANQNQNILLHLVMHPHTQEGSTSESVKNYDAIYQEQKNPLNNDMMSHRLTVTVENVTVEFSSATLKKDTLLPFASLVDYDKLRSLSHEH